MSRIRRVLLAVVALVVLFAVPANASTGPSIYVAAPTCPVDQTVRYVFAVHANSTPVTGFYQWMAGYKNGGIVYWNGAFKAVNVPAGTTFHINTGASQILNWTGTYDPRFKFTSGSPAIPAPNVVYGGWWCG